MVLFKIRITVLLIKYHGIFIITYQNHLKMGLTSKTFIKYTDYKYKQIFTFYTGLSLFTGLDWNTGLDYTGLKFFLFWTSIYVFKYSNINYSKWMFNRSPATGTT